jgi:dipeptidyl aminopeptidase/acylaminoacyl peptidase
MLNSRMLRFTLLLLVAPVGVSILALALSARYARSLVKPTRFHVTERQRQDAQTRLPGLEEVALKTRDGLVLRGWFVPGRVRDAIVLVHGLFGNRYQLLPEAEILARGGHGVLLYDSRASGDSDGETATWGDRERLDITAALDFLTTRVDVDPSRLGLYGFSVGGSAVALAGAADRRVRAVLLGPTWTSLQDELANKFHRWGVLSTWAAVWTFKAYGVDVGAIRPVDVIHAILPRPLMLMSGSLDQDTPPAITQRLHGAVPSAEIWLVPGAGHGGYAAAAPAEFARRFSRFFEQL